MHYYQEITVATFWHTLCMKSLALLLLAASGAYSIGERYLSGYLCVGKIFFKPLLQYSYSF